MLKYRVLSDKKDKKKWIKELFDFPIILLIYLICKKQMWIFVNINIISGVSYISTAPIKTYYVFFFSPEKLKNRRYENLEPDRRNIKHNCRPMINATMSIL